MMLLRFTCVNVDVIGAPQQVDHRDRDPPALTPPPLLAPFVDRLVPLRSPDLHPPSAPSAPLCVGIGVPLVQAGVVAAHP
eukprot:491959-Prorocentrum_minimum.AAC.1